ncbi:hypothetical protein EMIHUDRAFT_234608 [Emiliania huxleyi CCMP1516]|uniref:Uncharacterized protein n=2 Tax=Emiliania huxleyi TaxID=2903 RepID=A0A0D3JZ38_EMIH1|nr:hypothetical protein EMIHUDRAFT_234608 [Emiliania huxleyi CCMP1516]EOD28773.1 hypothetical protein EMIHUDRAFT_234608 [Emiliania huxleyi CCMP1516]|eukprot:XP_005781202.1 hypothetical protein EMIHUDRAFT_234608 [Emiliania huxleyi CCMP1516]
MSHPETIYPAPASYERAQAALAALDTARESLRSSEYSEADQRTALCWLANELGTTRPERGTLAAIRAVLEKLDRPDVFRRDQDAWEAHGAKPRSFKSWKSKIHGLLLTDADDAFLEFTAFSSLSPEVNCFARAGLGSTTRETAFIVRVQRVLLCTRRALFAARSAARAGLVQLVLGFTLGPFWNGAASALEAATRGVPITIAQTVARPGAAEAGARKA